MNIPVNADLTRPLSEAPVRLSTEPYLSADYARAEGEKLWSKIWQMACRVEEIPNVGDFVTYDILDQSIVVARAAPDRIVAYHNVCRHRGRRLTSGCGHARKLVCPYHGWTWNLEGENEHVVWGEDWGDKFDAEKLRLGKVNVDSWGGWVFVNLDPKCEPLRDYLAGAADMLDPFELDKMRYNWRQWLYFPCNWKVALEAFMEGYHLPVTHPQRTRFGGRRSTWSRGYGKHAVFGTRNQQGFAAMAGFAGASDYRTAAYDSLIDLWEGVRANTTEAIIGVAKRLVDELPEGTPSDEVMAYLMKTAREEDAARGVHWPDIDPQHIRNAGIGWTIFPNLLVLQGLTTALCYRARPHGFDPDQCIFEVFTLERFPEGEEPRPENVYQPDVSEEGWRKILMQDFLNMPEVQAGMKSKDYQGPIPNPWQEETIVNFHRALAEYMGTGGPTPL